MSNKNIYELVEEEANTQRDMFADLGAGHFASRISMYCASAIWSRTRRELRFSLVQLAAAAVLWIRDLDTDEE